MVRVQQALGPARCPWPSWLNSLQKTSCGARCLSWEHDDMFSRMPASRPRVAWQAWSVRESGRVIGCDGPNRFHCLACQAKRLARDAIIRLVVTQGWPTPIGLLVPRTRCQASESPNAIRPPWEFPRQRPQSQSPDIVAQYFPSTLWITFRHHRTDASLEQAVQGLAKGHGADVAQAAQRKAARLKPPGTVADVALDE